MICLAAALTGLAGVQPQPSVVTPGQNGHPPSDAVVLFDGSNLSHWVHTNGHPARWALQNGEMVCNTGAGDIQSRDKLGSAQIHVEFATPNMPTQHDQARGNSGVYLQGRYEVQILDSYQNPTYPNGSCGALYGQHAPRVNASRPPEQWQSYDIVFHAPKCAQGEILQPGTLTLFHNGVLVQDHVVILGPTSGAATDDVCTPGPLLLQDHFHPDAKATPMRFRNIWYRPLDSAGSEESYACVPCYSRDCVDDRSVGGAAGRLGLASGERT